MVIVVRSKTALIVDTLYFKVDEVSFERDLKTLVNTWSKIVQKTDPNWGNYVIFICREKTPELQAILDKYEIIEPRRSAFHIDLERLCKLPEVRKEAYKRDMPVHIYAETLPSALQARLSSF